MFDDPIGIGGAISPYGQNVEAMVWQIRAVASNVLMGTNPPYLLSDFLATYPQFGGAQVAVTGTTTEGSNHVTGVTATGITVGMLCVSVGTIPDLTIVTNITGTTVTLSENALASGGSNLTFYSPLVPVVMLQMYLAMATAAINQRRWCSLWQWAVGRFVAHFCVLDMQAAAQGAGSSAAQVMAAGEARGLKVAKSAGDISKSIDFMAITKGIDGWADWLSTIYGQQLATRGRIVGTGGIYVP